MKAVIVDLSGQEAVALCNDGSFIKLKNANYTIGQEIQMQPKVVRFPKQIAVAASLAIVLGSCGGVGTYAWAKPVSVVSLDINPSIEYSLNRFDRVISVTGKNNDGERVVDALGDSCKNTDITTALTITVEQLSTDAYLDSENTNYMVIGVYSKNDSKASSLKDTVDAFTPESEEVCSIATVNVSEEVKETADSLGITGGKMELINEIASSATDPSDVDYTTMTDMTVAQLEETKLATASGASVPEAVASANAPDSDVTVASESKKTQDKSDTTPSSDVKSEDKNSDSKSSAKDSAAGTSEASTENPAKPADTVASVTTASGTGNSSSSVASTEDSTAQKPETKDPASLDNASDSSTNKADKGTSSKKNTQESNKKNDGSGSSPAKGEDTSPSKTEDADATTNSTSDSTEDSSSTILTAPVSTDDNLLV